MAAKNNLNNLVRHASSEMGKGGLTYFSPKCSSIILLSKEYFSVFICRAVWFDKLAKFGVNLPISPKIGDEATNPVTGY